MNTGELSSKNPEMASLKQNLAGEFPGIEFLKEGPASKSEDKKTDVVGKILSEDPNGKESFLKGFTKTGRVLGETEYKLIDLFNHFSIENNSSFSGPDISEIGETKDGGYYFLMKDAKQGGKKELDFSKMEPDEIMKLYDEYRQTFDKFKEYSKGKTSTESNPALQRIYSISNKYKDNIMFELVGNPILKKAVAKKYKNKVNERIFNGQSVVRVCGVDVDREKINKSLDKLLSKITNLDFEYNFGRFWTGHVFSDGKKHKFVDFDNVAYQIEGTELIGIMRSNLLLSAGNYSSYDEWKSSYDGWYAKLLEAYEDENLVKLLLFVKLVGTVFEDYGHLIYEREGLNKEENQDNDKLKEKKQEIEKGIERNYRALQEFMKE